MLTVNFISFLSLLKPEEIEEQQAKYEMVFKNIEELDRQGVQILSPREIERLRKRFRDVHTKFTQYQKPTGDGKCYFLRERKRSTVQALLADTLVSGQLYLRPP